MNILMRKRDVLVVVLESFFLRKKLRGKDMLKFFKSNLFFMIFFLDI